MSETREERDQFGSVSVPADALYGAATARALQNSSATDVLLRDRPELVVGMAAVKVAAARANGQLGVIDREVADAIVVAAREIVQGRWHDQFPLPVLQGGGGTGANMNTNEVVASRATQVLRERSGDTEPVHPLDHVNRSQSSNDVYPTALNIAVVRMAAAADAALRHLARVCDRRGAAAPPGLTRLGRTCLQDALPIPVADATHRMHARSLAACADQLTAAAHPLLSVPLGATAVGTGFGAPPGYQGRAVDALREETALDLVVVDDPFDALANAGPLLRVMHAICRAAVVMAKIAQDLRFLSSGPLAGIGELTLPAVQVGSSAMPGKVNPVLPELVIQISHRVRGAALSVECATAAGELELNVMTPVIALELLGSLSEVARACRLFADRCVVGLTWNTDAVERHLQGSLADAVSLAESDGYSASSRRFPLTYPPLGG